MQMVRRLYIVVREDLPPGASSHSQVAHALTEYSFKYPRDFKEWHDNSNTLVVCQVPDMNALLDLVERAAFEHVPRALFLEPDLDDTLTAVAFEPGVRSEKFLKKLDLLEG